LLQYATSDLEGQYQFWAGQYSDRALSGDTQTSLEHTGAKKKKTKTTRRKYKHPAKKGRVISTEGVRECLTRKIDIVQPDRS
jgi:hypothetical protein